MRKRLLALTTAMALAASIGAAPASAGTEFGSNCAATGGASGYDFVYLSHGAASSLPVTAPVSGVITRWKSTSGIALEPGAFSVSLQLYRAAGPSLFTLVNETPKMPMAAGVNSFPTRVPVQAGDFLGLSGLLGGVERGAIYCQTGDPADSMGVTNEPAAVGGTRTFSPGPGYEVPMAAVIEADADNDGFGDETQDACPQSAAVQVACPPVALSTSTQVKKGSVTVIVTSSTAAPVTVKGVAKLGKGKKAKLNGGTQNMIPGTLAKFRLFFTKGLKNKLKELPPKRSVRLNVNISSTNVAGAVTTKVLKIKLKGQAKPAKSS